MAENATEWILLYMCCAGEVAEDAAGGKSRARVPQCSDDRHDTPALAQAYRLQGCATRPECFLRHDALHLMTNYRIRLHSRDLTACKGVQAHTLLRISNLGALHCCALAPCLRRGAPRGAAPILSCSARTAHRHCRNSCTVGRTYSVFGVYHAPWQLRPVPGRFLHLPEKTAAKRLRYLCSSTGTHFQPPAQPWPMIS